MNVFTPWKLPDIQYMKSKPKRVWSPDAWGRAEWFCPGYSIHVQQRQPMLCMGQQTVFLRECASDESQAIFQTAHLSKKRTTERTVHCTMLILLAYFRLNTHQLVHRISWLLTWLRQKGQRSDALNCFKSVTYSIPCWQVPTIASAVGYLPSPCNTHVPSWNTCTHELKRAWLWAGW